MTLKTFSNLVQMFFTLIILIFVGWQINLLRHSADYEFHLAMIGYGIVGLFVAGVIAENVGRVAVAFGCAKAQIGNTEGDGNG